MATRVLKENVQHLMICCKRCDGMFWPEKDEEKALLDDPWGACGRKGEFVCDNCKKEEL